MRKTYFKCKLFLIIVSALFLIPSLSAEEIASWNDHVKIEQITNSYEIIDKDVQVETIIEFFVEKDIIQSDNFTIMFDPWEPIYSPPIENVSFNVCLGGMSSSSYYEITIACEKNIPYYTITENINDHRKQYCSFDDNSKATCIDGLLYKDYQIILDTKKIETPNRYVIKISYLAKDRILEQGNYDIFRTFFGNMRNQNVKSYIVLPSIYSVPEKIFPANTEFQLDYIQFRPVFILDKALPKNFANN